MLLLIHVPQVSATDAPGLELAWRIPLGSAYSRIAVAGDQVVTMYADAEADWVGAFDAASGKALWRHRLGDVTKGHDGSDDGPLSTPVIGKGTVFAIGADGVVVALRLKDGDLVWRKRLEQDFGGTPPFFGFTTTPLFDSGVLVVQAGAGEGAAIVGLNTKNGKKVWALGDGKVDYQSPAVMTLSGKQMVVAVSATTITGVDAARGDVLFTHELGEEDRVSSGLPAFIGDDRFLVLMSGGATVYRVSRSGEGFEVEELYRTKTFGETYAPPVYHDGHLYGFRGQILSCAVASTGERVWRSRPPGGDGLILVDGRLVIFGAGGNVVVAEATPDGYREQARVQALDGSSLTWPSFDSGRVFVRNLEEMAAVSLTAKGGAAPVAVSAAAESDFEHWLESLQVAGDREATIDAFFEQHEQMPIVEGDRVHFVYRGAATDVAIAGSMIDAEVAESMIHVEGTDLFYRTYRLEPGTRWEYNFQLDFETWMPDPRNPRSVPAIEGDHQVSELIIEGYSARDHVEDPTGPRGKIDEITLSSEILDYEKKIKVWLPPGYDKGDSRYPLLVVNDGFAWLDKGLMANSLDNLVGEQVVPLVVAFVDATPQWWLEAGGSHTGDYVRMQVEELIPLLAERYRLAAGPPSRAVMGKRFFGLTTVYAALKHPEVFGSAAIMSVYLGLGAGEEVEALAGEGAGKSVRFYVDWNRYDERRVDRGYDFAEDSRRLAETLRSGGYSTAGGEVLDSRGWGGWRNRTDRLLATLFPAD
jgi:enterochelin esterase-like enzyme/outer membrane protein assembly factor BamB